MDEALATVAVDLGGRAACIFAVDFPVPTIGTFDAQLVDTATRQILRARRFEARESVAGTSAEQLVAALAAEIRAQDQQHASTGFAPSLPDIARWLKERRFAAYLQQNQPAGPVAPAAFDAPIDPETGAPDPFAYHRHVTGQ
jgi:hypothetical protein